MCCGVAPIQIIAATSDFSEKKHIKNGNKAVRATRFIFKIAP